MKCSWIATLFIKLGSLNIIISRGYPFSQIDKFGDLRKFLLLTGIVTFLVSGCTTYLPTTRSTEALPKKSSESTVEPIVTAVPARLTSTRTPVPTLIPSQTLTPTRLPVITPTFYPIQTLSIHQKLSIMDFLEGTKDCQIPCWNGLTPGVSSSSEIQGYFARLGYVFPPSNFDFSLESGEYSQEIRDNFPPGSLLRSWFYVNVQWSGGIVSSLGFGEWDHPEQVTTSRISEVLGTPQRILVYQEEGYRYRILYDYPNRNSYIIITGDRKLTSTPKDLPFSLCINNPKRQTFRTIFYSEDTAKEYEKEYNQFPWLDWSSLLKISTEELFKKLQQPDICLPSP
jgi:hypothetical protein